MVVPQPFQHQIKGVLNGFLEVVAEGAKNGHRLRLKAENLALVDIVRFESCLVDARGVLAPVDIENT